MARLALLASLIVSSVTRIASAMCPLCVIGAAAALSIARYYGVDDTIVGLWLGALAVSTAIWLVRVANRRIGRRIPFQGTIIFVAVVLATILPFYYAGFFNGMPGMSDEVFGLNKILFGVLVGGAATYLGSPLSQTVRRLRGGRSFPYQGIVVTLGLLAILSVLLWIAVSLSVI